MITPVLLLSNEEYWLPYALEATRGFFDKYVFYSIGSNDATNEIIQWWTDTNPNCEFVVKMFPMLHPAIQGCFRNSMIMDSVYRTKSSFFSNYYFILDGDEIYTPEGMEKIIQSEKELEKNPSKLYGVFRRIEINKDLKSAYGVDKFISHHRIYRFTTPWIGNHPGEAPVYSQNSESQLEFRDITCYHFHNCSRSPKDAEVPKRLERRGRATYSPGELNSIDIFDKLPILKKQIEDFPTNPELKKLQDEMPK